MPLTHWNSTSRISLLYSFDVPHPVLDQHPYVLLRHSEENNFGLFVVGKAFCPCLLSQKHLNCFINCSHGGAALWNPYSREWSQSSAHQFALSSYAGISGEAGKESWNKWKSSMIRNSAITGYIALVPLSHLSLLKDIAGIFLYFYSSNLRSHVLALCYCKSFICKWL